MSIRMYKVGVEWFTGDKVVVGGVEVGARRVGMVEEVRRG